MLHMCYVLRMYKCLILNGHIELRYPGDVYSRILVTSDRLYNVQFSIYDLCVLHRDNLEYVSYFLNKPELRIKLVRGRDVRHASKELNLRYRHERYITH